MPSSSNTCNTPMWAKPRAAPPPSARPNLGIFLGGGGVVGATGGELSVTGSTGLTGGGTVAQAASKTSTQAR